MNENILANKFIEILTNWKSDNQLFSVYSNLFKIKEMSSLEEDLAYVYKLYKGTDSYFKETSIDCWFFLWHKMIRQTDYFTDCFKKTKVVILTEEQKSEFKFLWNTVKEKSFSKTDGKKDGRIFNDTYMRYLELRQLSELENHDVSIGGHLDMILWNAVHVDKKSELRDAFIELFKWKERNNY